MASEVGVLEVPPERVLLKGRLQPGRMFLVDTEEGGSWRTRRSADDRHRTALPQWLNRHMLELAEVPGGAACPEPPHQPTVLRRQQVFGVYF